MGFSTRLAESRAAVFEIKFLIPPHRIEDVREWARARLRPDRFGGGPHGDTYRTASLYYDTAAFDVYHRRGSFGRSKYRIRRYDASLALFLERKLKTREEVSKRRSVIRLAELHALATGQAEPGWAGYWFHRRVLARELHPVCQISYARTAFEGEHKGEPLRMTLDEDVRALPQHRLEFHTMSAGRLLAARNAILELKFRHSLPPVFEELIGYFSLSPQPFSKYRQAVSTLGLASTAPARPTLPPALELRTV